MFNNSYPNSLYSPTNSNFLSTYVGYRIYPVGSVKEIENVYPDMQGNPLFFYDQSTNNFIVKQRDIKTLMVQELKYKLDETSIKPIKEENPIQDRVEELEAEIKRLNALVEKKEIAEVIDDK